jgi:hypothetical protein
VVIRTYPVSGAIDIESGEIELSATFSKPMNPDSFTWAPGQNILYPKGLSRPRFSADHRTCSFVVLVEPGKTYACMLNNGDRNDKFKDEAGVPSLPYLLSFTTKPIAIPPPSETQKPSS